MNFMQPLPVSYSKQAKYIEVTQGKKRMSFIWDWLYFIFITASL